MRNPNTAPELNSRPYPILFYVGLSLGLFFLTYCGKNDLAAPLVPQANQLASLIASGSPDFAAQLLNTVSARSFTLTNQGKAMASEMSSNFYLSINFAFKGGAYPGIGGTCGSSLAPGESCSLVVEFAPKYYGAYETPLEIQYNNSKEVVTYREFTLKGSGV